MKFAAAVRFLLLVSAFLAVASPDAEAVEKLKIDPEHSSVGFSVRHLFTRVQGRFTEFAGTLDFDEKAFDGSKAVVTIHAASVDTNVEGRDDDLRSKRFFDVEEFPTLEFVTGKVKKVGGNRLRIIGSLTMHGVTKDVVLDGEFLGAGKDPWGNQRYGFHATTTVNRKDFGMKWNEALETGGVLVGDDVEIVLDIEAVPAEAK